MLPTPADPAPGPANRGPSRELIVFSGRLDTADFMQWVHHRACKLGLFGHVRPHGEAVLADVTGPDELIDAMALCCSLGPVSSWVETVERTPATPHQIGATAFEIRPDD
ncbi:MAG: acylphosphatase [Pseudomonadota bacterium]